MNQAIREAIKDANKKDKLCLVAAITTVPEERLIEIMNSAEMTIMEEAMLKVHVAK